jgi:uncharacterized protein involved in outer membrane biogenesis
VQTTLLGIAIAFILALATALVGPLCVDWSRYRPEFEARASRLTGLEFHITGPIDARALPTPTLVMQGIEIARPAHPGNVRARALRIEFGLGALMRGEWRITDAVLEGPELDLGIDAGGQVDWSKPKVRFHPEGVSIERLHVRDGRVAFRDAASGLQLLLEQIEFRGELRSLSGPFKGEGSFVAAGQRFPYRVAAARIEDSGIKVRLFVDPVNRLPMAEADMVISVDHGTPRFEGQLQLARPVGRAASGSQSPLTEPWRLAGRLKGSSSAAVLEQMEFQYGPDERAIKLKGSAQFRFGADPRASLVFSATQLDLDRIPSLSETDRRRPITAARMLSEALVEALPLPIPATASIAVESLTLGAAALQRVSAEIESSAGRLEIRNLQFRAPGLSQVELSGALEGVSSGMRFSGPIRIEANDPRGFLAWIADRSDVPQLIDGPLRVRGDASLSAHSIAFEGLDVEVDHMHAAGRLAYRWGKGEPRVDAELTAPELDLDRLYALGVGLVGDALLPRPREGALSLKIGRALVLGIEARQADVTLRLDAQGLAVDHILVADFGGATVAIRGRIDTGSRAPGGGITLDMDARALDGVLALTQKYAPEMAEQIRRIAGRITPLTLRASLAVDGGAASNRAAGAKFKIDGRAGAFRIAALADASDSNTFDIRNLKATILAATKFSLVSRVETDDGAALLDVMRIAPFVSVDRGSGRFAVTAKGSPGGDLDLDISLTAGSLAASTKGKVRFAPVASRWAELDVKVNNASIRSPRPVAPGGLPEILPVSVTTHVALAGDTVRLTDLTGSVAGNAASGRLTFGIQQPMTVDGDLDLAAIDLPGAVATGVGVPVRPTGGGGDAGIAWPNEPFERMIGPLTGQVRLSSKKVIFTPKIAARDFKGVLHFDDSRLGLQVSEATLAGGRLSGELILLREPDGLIARSRLRLTGANAAELLPGEGAISGLLRLEMTAEGSGMSPLALMGSLEGGGTFTLEKARIARLDPRAFDVVVRAVDQGVAIDTDRLRDRTDTALAGGALSIARAEGTITISAGQARLANSMEAERGVDLSIKGSVGLRESDIDARLVLTGLAVPGASRNAQPEIVVTIKGPMKAPKRSVDVTAFASWLALRAVDQQSKKLDVLEGAGKEPEPGATEQAPPEKPSAQGARSEAPAVVAPPSPEYARQKPATRSARKPKPVAGQSLYPPAEAHPSYFWFGMH